MYILVQDKTIDNLFTTVDIIEEYTSFIWTEYFQSVGDFELTMAWSSYYHNLLYPGRFIRIDDSRRIMRVEERYSSLDDDGKRILNVKGKSTENIFNYRVALSGWNNNYDAKIYWHGSNQTYNGMVTWMVNTIRNGIGSYTGTTPNPNTTELPSNRIRNLSVGRATGLAAGPYVNTSEAVRVDQGNALKAIEAICLQADIGYRMVTHIPDANGTPLRFDCYTPIDRTVPGNDYVLFSEALGNIDSVRTYDTIVNYYNVVHVNGAPFGKITMTMVNEGLVSSDDYGRTIGYVSIDTESERSSSPEAPGHGPLRRAAGLGFLSEHPREKMVDGVTQSNTQYTYMSDYNLGDLVAVADLMNETHKLRVVSQTFISDSEGVRSYPTLKSDDPA